MNVMGPPSRPEINEYTIKFIIGGVAITLPFLAWYLAGGGIDSISESYWYEASRWPRNILIGALCAIAAFMLAYNGRVCREWWLAKIGAFAAMGVALYPCGCAGKGTKEVAILFGASVHGTSAAVLFVVLLFFCHEFRQRARRKASKGMPRASWRANLYMTCFLGLVTSFGLFIASFALKKPHLIFWGEMLGLVCFGVSWLLASRVLPGITDPSERNHLFEGATGGQDSSTQAPEVGVPAN